MLMRISISCLSLNTVKTTTASINDSNTNEKRKNMDVKKLKLPSIVINIEKIIHATGNVNVPDLKKSAYDFRKMPFNARYSITIIMRRRCARITGSVLPTSIPHRRGRSG